MLEEEIREIGADNLFKRLQAVLLARPTYYDIVTPINWWQEKWKGKIDKEVAYKQHERLVETLEGEKIQCHFLELNNELHDQKDVRDIGIISESKAIGCKLDEKVRRGEEEMFAKFCKKRKIPIAATSVPFEGGDFFFIDKSVCLLGIGRRTKASAGPILQKVLGRKVELINHASYHHLDGVFNILSPELVVYSSKRIKPTSFLKKNAIELSEKDIEKQASNFLLLDEMKVLSSAECKEFNKKLELQGCDVIEVEVSELKKNGGSIRCMTLPLLRK